MLCSPVDVVPEGDEWVLEGKLDGWRAVTHVRANDIGLFGGRNGSNYSGKLPYIEDALRTQLPPDTALDGELIGAEWGSVQGVMTRGSGPHIPSRAVPPLMYVVFDLLRLDGEDVRARAWEERRELLEGLPLGTPVLRLSPVGDSTEAAHRRMLALGLEGSVCKRRCSRYVSGARSNLWVKIKPQATAEAKIVGFKDGEGSFKGLVGAIEFKLPNGQCSSCSGFDLRLRRVLSENRDGFIGRTIEVKHHGETAEGKLRHPQFLRFREDRDAVSPRQAQVMQAALKQASASAVVPARVRQVKQATAPAKRRMRNYAAMNDAKLLTVRAQLRDEGDAYERCVERGSGNPDADLAVVEGLIQERGL